jgi:pyridoxamine 5'-phosphate oxidase
VSSCLLRWPGASETACAAGDIFSDTWELCSARHSFAHVNPSVLDGNVTPTTPDPRIDLAAMRQAYATDDGGVREAAFNLDWLGQFRAWLADAAAAGLPEPNAMTVATADDRGRPSARTVLLKDVDHDGFTFYTNYESRKGIEVAANPYASLVFGWFAIARQVIVCGPVERVGRAVTEAYFASRPRESQLGAWASPQSQVVPDRATLDRLLAETEARFAGVEPIPAPPHWGGLRVRPETIEFWHGRVGRLHDRLRYRRGDDQDWIIERLGP